MKNILYFIFYYLIIKSICQNSVNNNEKESNRNLDTKEEQPENNNEDNPLVFNVLFEEIRDEWTRTMSDFESHYIYLVPVQYKDQAEFFENITKVPCKMRGAFLLEDATSNKDVIDFQIISPNKKVVFQSSSFGAIFNLNLTEKGLYTILFSNRYLNKEVKPTLIMNSGQNLFVEKENLSNTEKKLDSLLSYMKKYEQDYKLNRGFKRQRNEELSQTNKYFFIFSLVETIVLIGVSIWQYYYLKHLFEMKGSL